MDTMLAILQWAIPSGGIGAAIAWIANRRLRTVEEKKKVEDTYKQMYDMVSEELTSVQRQNLDNYEKMEELRAENDKTRRMLARLSRAIEAIQSCPHRVNCPISAELQDDATGAVRGKRGKRQLVCRKTLDKESHGGVDHGDDGGTAGGAGGDDHSDREPP